MMALLLTKVDSAASLLSSASVLPAQMDIYWFREMNGCIFYSLLLLADGADDRESRWQYWLVKIFYFDFDEFDAADEDSWRRTAL